MDKHEGHNLKALIFRAIIALNALFLMGISVNQVSAAESDKYSDNQSQNEVVLNETHEEFEEEVAGTNSDKNDEKGIDKGSEEENSETEEETIPEADIDEPIENETDNTEHPGEDGKDGSTEEIDAEENTENDEDEETTSDELQDENLENSSEIDVDTKNSGEENQNIETSKEEADAEEQSETIENEEAITATTTAALKTTASNDTANVNRIDGSNRYSNAVEISKKGWSSASKVFLVNGEKFADALTGSPLAALHNAPILLTRGNNLPSETLAELKRLNALEVVVLGGIHSVPEHVLNTLRQNGFIVSRIGGNNRYSQAELVANEIMKIEGKNRDAFLASGEVYSDALSISTIASSKRLPIFLTRGNRLEQSVLNAMPSINSWTIIGGYNTIDQSIEQQMKNAGARVRRIGGNNRYEVNQNVLNHYGTPKNHMYVTSGDHYSDTLPASVLAAKENSGILLVNDNNTSTTNRQKIFAQNTHNIRNFTFIGGPLTLSQATLNNFRNIAKTVYLDPGHGGKEPGAVSFGIDEKDLNLSISKIIQGNLLDSGYHVVMSRETDVYLGLSERAREANSLNADIFVSVHNNAMPPGNSGVNGIETFHYPGSREGNQLATVIHNELIRATGANNRGVKSADFAVIRESHMPAVLLELGFMTNRAELNKLLSNSYQNLLAKAVTAGIKQYLN